MDRTDAELVSETLAGDRDAFASLIRRYQDHAYGAAIGMLSDFELARDVVQEAFLAAYCDLRKLREPERFAGWLHGIVRNLARRAIRELKQVRSLAKEMGHTTAAVDPSPGPHESAEDAEARGMVLTALERLSDNHREVVSLHYVDGLSYRDIAGFLDVSETTVQGRLQRGREALRREMRMVKDTFDKHKLPEDFSHDVTRLLDLANEAGNERENAVQQLAELGSPAVEPLCEALSDPRIAVRQAAACALCRIGDERALKPILRLLYVKDSWLHSKLFASGRVLGVPGVRDELLRMLDGDEATELYWAVQILSHVSDDGEVFERLMAVFRDEVRRTVGMRCHALAALCRLQPDRAAELVAEALADPESRRRSGWAWWIATREGYVLPAEVCRSGFTRDMAPNSRRMAGELMLRLGDEGREILEELLHGNSSDERAVAALALARGRGADVFDALMAELLSGYQRRKWQRIVARSVVRHYPDELCAWADANDVPADRPHVAWALAKVRIATGRGTPEDLFRNGTPSSRMAALRALAREKGAALIPELRDYLREGQPRKVAQEAFWQMYRLRDASMPAVEEMLTSEHWTERKAALCLLRRWGKLTPELKAQGDADEHIAVRHAANWHPGYIEAAKWHPKWRRRLERLS
jgi:RNA polymerase sigma factor (sigma-70 family)